MPQPSKSHLKVQPLSGFDKSFYHDLTANVGSLVPAMWDEVPAGFVNLNVAASVQLPPVASDTFMKTDLKLEAFFCPHRLLYGGWEKFYSNMDVLMLDSHNDAQIERAAIPCVSVSSRWESIPNGFQRGQLFDYLGARINGGDYSGAIFNMLSALCYHKIYDDWYRSALVQQQVFSDGLISGQSPQFGVSNMPYMIVEDNNFMFSYNPDDDATWADFVDGSNLFQLRQRNYGLDYFTNSWPTPQLGSAMTVATDGNGNFTIAALRAANSFQIFSERNNLTPRYFEAVKQRTGFEPSSMDVNRPVFLGSASIPITTYGVDVNAANFVENTSSDAQQNPFANSAGAQLGRAVGRGAVNLIDNFKCTEPGFIMVMASIVPRAVYSSGINRALTRYIQGADSITDHANAVLQNVGNEPIYQYELNGINSNWIFGYTDRYASWKTKHDMVSGELREDGSLSSFCLKRNFVGSINLNSSFLQIPITALDEISATDTYISSYGAWMQFGFDYKVAQPLALYSVPSLQDPAYEHGQDVELYRGGFRL